MFDRDAALPCPNRTLVGTRNAGDVSIRPRSD
jgi:hypothetical protein